MKRLIILLITTLLLLSSFTGCNVNDKNSQHGGENNSGMNSSTDNNSQYVGENDPDVNSSTDNNSQHVDENDPDVNSNNLQWENDVALYVDIYFEGSYPTSKDIENTFENYKYTRMYLVNKSVENNPSITLLFIFDSTADKETFRSQVKNDIGMAYTRNCRDIPYESTDTRYIECEKDIIEIGEAITLELKGTKDYYMQPFDFEGFLVLPQKSLQSKEYQVSDFPQIDLKEIETLENGWLYFHLNSSDYYNLIYSIDAISRLDMFEKIKFDKREITMIPPSIWEFSDDNIVEIVEHDDGSGKITVKGISKGEVLISFEGIVYKLTVI